MTTTFAWSLRDERQDYQSGTFEISDASTDPWHAATTYAAARFGPEVQIARVVAVIDDWHAADLDVVPDGVDPDVWRTSLRGGIGTAACTGSVGCIGYADDGTRWSATFDRERVGNHGGTQSTRRLLITAGPTPTARDIMAAAHRAIIRDHLRDIRKSLAEIGAHFDRYDLPPDLLGDADPWHGSAEERVREWDRYRTAWAALPVDDALPVPVTLTALDHPDITG